MNVSLLIKPILIIIYKDDSSNKEYLEAILSYEKAK